jgi:hypothetical protein
MPGVLRRHAGQAEDLRIDEQDVGHRQEGREAGAYLGGDVGAAFGETEVTGNGVHRDLSCCCATDGRAVVAPRLPGSAGRGNRPAGPA